MAAYYNEIDPFAAQWLRELIKAGHIADGIVDERSIEDVLPDDLVGFTQCHFFAGIGGWSYALRLAGVPDDYPVWTGSCPCQPFSQAGAGGGVDDERHLWPAFRWLIQQCRPAIVFGEQVASKDGRVWLSGVRTDLEALGYSAGAADLCAAGVEANNIRQRIYWFADSRGERDQGCIQTLCAGKIGQGWPDGPVDLREVLHSPFMPGRGFPQPLIRKMGNDVSRELGKLRGYGNAINPVLAAEFISASLEARGVVLGSAMK